jgi:hypothetical protein
MMHRYNKKNKTKKINKKNKSKKINKKNKSKKLLKGGGGKTSSSKHKKTSTASQVKSSTLPPRKSSRFSRNPLIPPSFKIPQKTINDKMKESEEKKIIEQQIEIEIQKNIDLFFENLKNSHFPEAICALYKLYTLFPYEKVKSQIHSSDFKKKYQDTFYFKKYKINSFGVMHCDFQAKNNYIYFLSYIFKKLEQGAYINCDGKELPFLYSYDKTKPSILSILKQFLGYLDTACVNTMSYTIPSEKYDLYCEILEGSQPASRYSELTRAENALAQIIYSLNILKHIFPSLQDILHNMVSRGDITSYSMNTTVLSRIIKQSYTDFLQPIPEETVVREETGVREGTEETNIEEVD